MKKMLLELSHTKLMVHLLGYEEVAWLEQSLVDWGLDYSKLWKAIEKKINWRSWNYLYKVALLILCKMVVLILPAPLIPGIPFTSC